MPDARPLRIKVFADGADLEGMLALAQDPLISGFTTNPTLMRRSGVTEYATFAKEVLAAVTEHPISFEVVADEFDEMRRQAHSDRIMGCQRLRQDPRDEHTG